MYQAFCGRCRSDNPALAGGDEVVEVVMPEGKPAVHQQQHGTVVAAMAVVKHRRGAELPVVAGRASNQRYVTQLTAECGSYKFLREAGAVNQ